VTFLLAGINAKFIQSNLAIRLIRAYTDRYSRRVRDGAARVRIAEWNVNTQTDAIVRGIYEQRPEAVVFSTYIWNRETVIRVAEDLRAVDPELIIGAGGPEVSYRPERAFSDCPALDFVIIGEGERTFAELADRMADQGTSSGGIFREGAFEALAATAGIAFRSRTGEMRRTEGRPLVEDLGEIPFPYGFPDDALDPANRIVYYESSRGCPYSCAYCLSSIERSVRFYPLERVFSDLDYFLERRWPLVKFVDRTFNIDPPRYRAIWNHIRERYNGATRFHFEIAADMLGSEDFALLERMPEGSIQFEIGVQSANPDTLRAVRRVTDLRRLADNLRRLPPSIHSHVDLIAGLPHEDLESFGHSFDYAFALSADVVQLGFLKVLAGTEMERIGLGDRGFRWSPYPPYEILRTPDIDYPGLLLLKDVEHVVDNLWNSGVFTRALRYLTARQASAFAFFGELSVFIRAWFPDGDLFLPRRHWDMFSCLAGFIGQKGTPEALEWLKFDFFMQVKPGRVPDWIVRNHSKAAHDSALESTGFLARCGDVRRIAYARSEFEIFDFGDGTGPTGYLFTYPSPEEKSSGAHFEKIPYNGR